MHAQTFELCVDSVRAYDLFHFFLVRRLHGNLNLFTAIFILA